MKVNITLLNFCHLYYRTWSKVSGSQTCKRCWPQWVAAKVGWNRTWWGVPWGSCRPNTARSSWRTSDSCTSPAFPKHLAGLQHGVQRASTLPSAPPPLPTLRARTTSMAFPNQSQHLHQRSNWCHCPFTRLWRHYCHRQSWVSQFNPSLKPFKKEN